MCTAFELGSFSRFLNQWFVKMLQFQKLSLFAYLNLAEWYKHWWIKMHWLQGLNLIQYTAGQLVYHPLQQLQLYSTPRSLNAKWYKLWMYEWDEMYAPLWLTVLYVQCVLTSAMDVKSACLACAVCRHYTCQCIHCQCIDVTLLVTLHLFYLVNNKKLIYFWGFTGRM